MRLVVAVLCMGLVFAVATALVVIDLTIKLLPVLVLALLVVVTLRIPQRRRQRVAASPAPMRAVSIAPTTAVFIRPPRFGDVHAAPGVLDGGRRPTNAAALPEQIIIGAEVVSEDDGRG